MNDGNLLKYFGAVFLLCFAYACAAAQGFNGIVPFESACEDVKRISGGKGCGQAKKINASRGEASRVAHFTKI